MIIKNILSILIIECALKSKEIKEVHPEILNPILLIGNGKTVYSLDDSFLIPIEAICIDIIIDFKEELVQFNFSDSLFMKNNEIFNLFSYEKEIKNNTLILSNKTKESSFDFSKTYLFIKNLEYNSKKFLLSFISLNRKNKKDLFNFISKDNNKAWKLKINLKNLDNSIMIILKTDIFQLSDFNKKISFINEYEDKNSKTLRKSNTFLPILSEKDNEIINKTNSQEKNQIINRPFYKNERYIVIFLLLLIFLSGLFLFIK